MRIINPVGPTNSPDIAIVGEAPGRQEEEQGLPFVGGSGRLLNKVLAKVGINRKDCYITNVVLERPPKNDFNIYYRDYTRKIPRPKLLEAWERVRAEIDRVKPKMTLLLGREALRAFTGKTSIEDYRGCMYYAYGHRMIPSFHPAYILRVYRDRPILEADFAKAVRQVRAPYKPQVYFNYNPSLHEVLARLRERPRRVVLDLETFGTPPRIRCIGLAWSKHEAMSIPIIKDWGFRWTLEEEYMIVSALQELLLCKDTQVVFQNFPFDVPVLEREYGLRFSNIYMDTMFAFHTLYPEIGRKSLNFLCSLYTDHQVYWHYSSASDDSTFKYNCMDCVVTYEASQKIEKELEEADLRGFYFNHIHPAISATARMGHRGVRIDTEKRDAIRLETEWKMLRLKKGIQEWAGDNFNPSSTAQVKALVYHKWRLPPQHDSKTRKVTTNDLALRTLQMKCPDKRDKLQEILDYRGKKILLSTFLDVKLKNGRVYTNYNVAGTVTGRLASSKTIEGFGANLQNIPRGNFRSIFCADDGCVLIKSDLSQAEYRCLVWFARIERVIKRFKVDPNFSIHKWNAAENIYHCPYEEITPTMYSNAKSGTYGANYGIEAKKVSMMYDIEINNARMILRNYHDSVPEVKGVFQKEIRDELRRSRRISNPLGRKRYFFGRLDEGLYRGAYSFKCQSTVADIITAALVELDSLGYEVVLQVHDELVVQCKDDPDEIAKTVSAIKHAMERPIKVSGVDELLIIPTEIKVGKNWYDMEEYKGV